MGIIFGTDFSEPAGRAALAAAALARVANEPMHLVHVVDLRVADRLPHNTLQAFLGTRQADLAALADRIATSSGAKVTHELVHGVADVELCELAAERRARLLVVAALGERQAPRWLVGSTAERIARTSEVPVLLVRDPESLVEWADGRRALKVLAALEQSASSKPALRFAAALEAPGGSDLVVAQVVWPPGEHSRFGMSGPVPLDRLEPAVEAQLESGFRKWAADVAGAGQMRVVFAPAWGKVDSNIAMLASIEGAKAIVVGRHRRSDLGRLWHGSVSAGVVHHADTNVFVVPAGEDAHLDGQVEYQVVLAATDFSPQAQRAARCALAMVRPGGSLRLLHVVEAGRPVPEAAALEQDWLEATPPGAAERRVRIIKELVSSDETVRGILQAAARCGADAICMGATGRGRLAEAILGSVAQGVLRNARIPVMLVPEPAD